MDVKPRTFWTRVTEALRFKRPPESADPDLPQVGRDGLLSEPATHPDDIDAEAEAGRPAGPLSRFTKRDQTLAQLQEGYQQVTQLMDQMQKHMAAQSERSERISASLEQLTEALRDLPEITRHQARTLEAIAAQLEATATGTQRLNEKLGELPKAARAQSEALVGIGRQLEVTGEQNVVVSQTVEKLSAALSALGQASHDQAAALKLMNDRTGEQNDLLSRLIARQGRRFVALFVVTVVLAAAAVALGIVAIALPG